jgi:hypothetical protein
VRSVRPNRVAATKSSASTSRPDWVSAYRGGRRRRSWEGVEGPEGALRGQAGAAGAPSPGSDEAALTILLRGDPYSGAAADAVAGIRDELERVAPSALLGGIPAENYDVEQANERDTRLIVPLVLCVVALILALVLRALLAPAYLILTVVASFAATLGLVVFAFSNLIGSGGIAFNLGPDVLHLPRRAGGRLQHLPDDAGPVRRRRSGARARASSPPSRTPAAW